MTTSADKALRGCVLAVLLFGVIGPIGAGLLQTGAASVGVMPALGADAFDLAPYRTLFAMPGTWASIRLSLVTGGVATLLSLIVAVGFCAVTHDRMSRNAAARWLTPFLAAPHAALAIGLAFVLAPSGWIARLLAPLLGLERPPDLALVNDPLGIALILGLMIKEVPFLLLVMLAALTQIPVRAQMAAGRALGYGRGLVWVKIVAPQVWPLIRLPLLVVLAYALSTVEMGIILGPSNPPVFAVFLTRLFGSPDLNLILPASAGAVLQALLVGAAFAGIWVGQFLMRRIGLWWLRAGGRGSSTEPLLRLATAVVLLLFLLGALAMSALAFWSVAWRWPWPALLPETWSLRAWAGSFGGWTHALMNTLILAGATTALSLALAIAWLEGEDRGGRGRARWAEVLIYLPLLVPQIAFLYGLNVLFLRIGISGGLLAAIWAQTLFVFPYVMIAMSDPWRALDPQLERAAASLGAGPWRRLFTVKLPVLLSPLLAAMAIGVAVSVAQYLPTLFMGAGRIATLTTEAVTLSSGSDRRVAGVYATLQAGLPFAVYGLAFVLPALLYRNRAAMKGGQQ
ncbi:ABC transporter permease [Sedimentitalea nanhaiensis]|uniref:Putative thiamine transport system permease protein n=1 Tax=Sedimentitalea nanhaiensis TaxID=999627 RepID=A0A1I7BIR2_9RHOB|nr:ABC transporter permease subunit [Sedimentitalea nanhaiensis]SFT87047.1 putative thiamine transport system permease protein [Sedimentitalea nanhaiensis]